MGARIEFGGRMLHRRSRVPAHPRRLWVPVLLLILSATSCTGVRAEHTDARSARSGGTLRLTAFSTQFRPQADGDAYATLDPGLDYTLTGNELLRGCLVRTLMNFDDRSGRGGVLSPDLASAPPTVSDDGLTWAFTLREGIHYAPPLESVTVTSADIERALVRAASIGTPYASYYAVIEGFGAVKSGARTSIAGLEAPDDHTLVIHLSRPTGDLGYRLALPAAAPVPQMPGRVDPLGVAQGHDADYGDYLVASGPYMYAGAVNEELDGSPIPAITLDGASSITLVRNPSWDSRTDPLRPAYVDRIRLDIGGDAESNATLVERGVADLQFTEATAIPRQILARYQADPGLSDRVRSWDELDLTFVAMNLAVPPFDDVSVRRAVSYAMNARELVRQMRAPPLASASLNPGRLARHVIPDAAEGNLLAAYDPFRGRSGTERRSRAFAAMERSSYDLDGDGRCDDPVCQGVRLVAWNGGPFPEIAETIRKDLHPIGIDIDIDVLGRRYGTLAFDPTAANAMTIFAWSADYPNPSTFFAPLLSGTALQEGYGRNQSLLGASARRLRGFGYEVTKVPSIDDRITQCSTFVGADQLACWALLDKYVMSKIVPWVPFFTSTYVTIGSERTHGIIPDAMTSLPALEQIWLTSASSG